MGGLIEKAKEKAGVVGWEPWLFEGIDGGVLCAGAVCPLVTKGKRKGKPNYRKHDKSTKKTVFVPQEQPNDQ